VAIENYFLEKIIIRPFPSGGSRLYRFKIYRSLGTISDQWEATIVGKQGDLPWESVLPYELIEQICASPVDCEEIVRIENVKYNGSYFNIRFIKYLDNGIVGIIHKINENTDSPLDHISTFDVEQYGELDEDKQMDIFHQYFNSNPKVRKAVLFYFFTHVMPGCVALKELT
jgi:hypothetical protein